MTINTSSRALTLAALLTFALAGAPALAQSNDNGGSGNNGSASESGRGGDGGRSDGGASSGGNGSESYAVLDNGGADHGAQPRKRRAPTPILGVGGPNGCHFSHCPPPPRPRRPVVAEVQRDSRCDMHMRQGRWMGVTQDGKLLVRGRIDPSCFEYVN